MRTNAETWTKNGATARAGSFVADALEGEGCYHYNNGDVYSGSYASGKKHGAGQLFFSVRLPGP